MSATARPSKLRTLDGAVALLQAGAFVAFGGFLIHNKPMAFVRAVVAANIGDLTIASCPTASLDADLLIGANLVRRTILGNVSFDFLGPAPSFERAQHSETVDIEICDEAIVVGGYLATIEGIPYHPLSSARGHDVAKGSSLLTPYRSHTGHDLVAVSPLQPDIAVIHVQQADEFGNGRHVGSIWGDELIAKAARLVILTTDEIIDVSETRRAPKATTIPGHLVDVVVHTPYGAHPCSSHGRYLFDEVHLRDYINAASTPDGFRGYVRDYVVGQDEYLKTIGGADRLKSLDQRFPW